MPKKKLTLKQEKFCQEVVKTRNPAEASRRAYNIGSKGGSKKRIQAQETASHIGQENLRKPPIKERIIDLFEGIISEEQVKEEHTKNIIQDEERNAKNKAIEMYYKLTEKGGYSREKTEIEAGDLHITIEKA